MTTSLTVAQLFSPAPSGVGPAGAVPLVPAAGSWLSVELQIAQQVQLPTTSWQSGAPERTILAIEAVSLSLSDANISQMAQGAFLDSSATGSVTYVTVAGLTVTIPVTPDPSNAAQNPTGAPGYEDALTQSVYDVYRLAATYASGPLALVNVAAGTVGPYSAGTYHAGNAVTGATYNNPGTLSIPSSAIAGTGGQVAGVQVGLSYSIITTTSAHGLSVGQSVYLSIPQSAGVTGLYQVFALVAAVTPTTFQVAVPSSGTWTAGGTVYLCTVATMQADALGISSNAGPGQVTTTITQNANVFVSNVVAWSGSNWESNVALAARARLSLASASPNGPSQAYVYFAETAQQILSEQTPAYLLTNGPVVANEYANPVTGIVTTVVASATPVSSVLGEAVTPGCAQLLVTGVSNANPCNVTCAGPTSLGAGQSMTVTISGVLGTADVNGTFLGTYVSADVFSIPIDTTSAGTYTGGGSVEGGDLGQIDNLIQDNVVPDGIVGALTVSALALPILVVATVVVPQAYVATYQLAVVTALQTLIANYAIGGNAPDYQVAYDDVVGALQIAGVLTLGSASYVREIQSLSINGGGTGAGVSFPSNLYQALLSPPTITVLGV
jgi:hypothetical protein